MVPTPHRDGSILDWATDATRAINAMGAFGTSGMLVRDGVGGIGFEGLPENRRSYADVRLPWTFSCVIDPESKERTGGWTNGMLQLGYNDFFRTPDLLHRDPPGEELSVVSDCDTTDDGEHWLEVNLSERTVKVRIQDETFDRSRPNDIEHNLIRVWIGTVADGRQTSGIHINPVVYKYL